MRYQPNRPAPVADQGRFIPPANSPVVDTPLWRDKRRPFFGLPWSFTTYTLFADRLIVESGIFTIKRDEIRLYRVLDITMNCTVLQRLFGLGTLKLYSLDSSKSRCYIRDITMPLKVMQLLSDTANNERIKYGFNMTEFIGQNW